MKMIRSNEAVQEQIHQLLREYNRPFWGEKADYSFHAEKDGQIVAGIVASSTYDTVEVEYLFVQEDLRGQGIGSSLLRQVEEAAKRDGKSRVLLNTYSFQAPGFYQKMGYRLLFAIEPCLGEYGQYFFLKEL